MSALAWGWILYGAGYPIWLGYALNRFRYADDDEGICFQVFIAITWPLCVIVYLPYRFFKWMGVRP